MKFGAVALLPACALVLFAFPRALGSGCGGSSSTNVSSGDGGSGSSSSGGTGNDGGRGDGGSSSSGGSGSGSSSGSSSSGGPVTCGAPATNYVMNETQCGSYRWAVKTGTDDDVVKVNMTPQVTTVQALGKLATPSYAPNCTRQPEELQLYELKDVQIEFEHEEADSDYHLVAFDTTGHTMVTEVPFPACVGHNPEHCSESHGTPWSCEITHARAAVDAEVPQGTSSKGLGLGTIIGPAFWDLYELNGTTHPSGMAPNGIEIHPILAICFGKGCDPLKGY